MSPPRPRVVFIGFYFSFVFSAARSPAFVSPSVSLSYFSLLTKPDLPSGCGHHVLFTRPAFPLTSWFSAVPWPLCHYTLHVCGVLSWCELTRRKDKHLLLFLLLVHGRTRSPLPPLRLVPSCPRRFSFPGSFYSSLLLYKGSFRLPTGPKKSAGVSPYSSAARSPC